MGVEDFTLVVLDIFLWLVVIQVGFYYLVILSFFKVISEKFYDDGEGKDGEEDDEPSELIREEIGSLMQ